MEKKSVDEIEARFNELLRQPPYPVDELVGMVAEVSGTKGENMAAALFPKVVEQADFAGALAVVTKCQKQLDARLRGQAVRDAFRKTTKDRLLLSFIDAVRFEDRSLREAVGRLNLLLSFTKGTRVLSAAWGLGTIRELDYFYRRITVDFRLRRGHQFTYDAACETLKIAPEDHILVLQAADPACIEKMLKDQPGAFVKAMLASFGDMPITRLEELSAQHGFVKSANWKKFWEGARADLHRDKLVEIPTRRAEPLHLKAAVESYGESWYSTLAGMKDPRSILSNVSELKETKEYRALGDDDASNEKRRTVAERLAFALKGAKGVDDALFARIAFCIAELRLDPYLVGGRFESALTEKSRAYLWEKTLDAEPRYLAAARTLPAREVGNLVAFMTSVDRDQTKQRLFAILPDMCFPLLSETLLAFKDDADCERAVAELLKRPNAPATLVTLVLGHIDNFAHWTEKPERQLPPLVVILMHAIALGEGKQGGETLRMQNIVRRLFAETKWLEDIFKLLKPEEQVLLFERFQASTAWDPSTHHMIVVRMTKIVPELAAHLVKAHVVKKLERITSRRSFAERQAVYQRLVKVEIPENTHRIEVAKGYGDLSENAEYQYAKDEQRALMQKEMLLQKDLNEVKAVDFDETEVPEMVWPGTMVTIVTAAGEERVYTVLGEWDNDLEKGIISDMTPLAQNMLRKKAGDTFEMSDAEGNISKATVKAVAALSDDIRAWLAAVPAPL